MHSYNSTIFASTTANEYYVFSANEDFQNSQSLNYAGDVSRALCDSWPSGRECNSTWVATTLYNRLQTGQIDILEPLECLNTYARPFQGIRGSVVLVYSNNSADRTSISFAGWEGLQYNTKSQCPPFSWICGRRCVGPYDDPCQTKLASFRKDISSWKPYGENVKHCLSERIPQNCRLLYSPQLAVVIIILNIFKSLIMLYVVLMTSESPLMTIGDAIVSFLQRSDETTEGMCLVSKDDFARKSRGLFVDLKHPREYQKLVRRRFASVSPRRWLICLTT